MHSELLMLHSNVLSRNYMEEHNDNCGSVSLFNSSTSKLPSKSYCKSILSHQLPAKGKALYSNLGCQGWAPKMFIQVPSIGRQSVACTKPILRGRAPYQGLHSPFAPPNRLCAALRSGGGDDGGATGNTINKQANHSSLVLIDLAA